MTKFWRHVSSLDKSNSKLLNSVGFLHQKPARSRVTKSRAILKSWEIEVASPSLVSWQISCQYPHNLLSSPLWWCGHQKVTIRPDARFCFTTLYLGIHIPSTNKFQVSSHASWSHTHRHRIPPQIKSVATYRKIWTLVSLFCFWWYDTIEICLSDKSKKHPLSRRKNFSDLYIFKIFFPRVIFSLLRQ